MLSQGDSPRPTAWHHTLTSKYFWDNKLRSLVLLFELIRMKPRSLHSTCISVKFEFLNERAVRSLTTFCAKTPLYSTLTFNFCLRCSSVSCRLQVSILRTSLSLVCLTMERVT